MVTPKPGKPVRGSTTGLPVMALLDLLGQRWILRVVWELRDGPLTFRALQERCDDISPTTLNSRLKSLREASLVELTTDGYRRTALGNELGEQMKTLTIWAERWSDELENDEGAAT
jgi:DNA-binding HxlR family transcriptional regulator